MSDTPPVRIRPLAVRDRDAWACLWRAYLDFYGTDVPEAVHVSSFDRMIAGNGGAEGEFRGLLAFVDGVPVGLVHFLFHRHGWKLEDVCYLQDLYVDPARRGTGLGRALIEAVYAAADAEGAPSVYWLTQDFNDAGRRLYDRIGTLTPFVKYARP